MTTLAQLPAAPAVGPSDLLPLSHGGLLYSVTVAQITAPLQPVIDISSGMLLGRNSAGQGMPEAVTVGTGLALANGIVVANGADHAGFPVQAAMSVSDSVVIDSGMAPGLLPVTALRALFSAGSGISIDGNGVITVTASSIAGPAVPQGPAGPAGQAGPQGATGAVGQGLLAPNTANAVSTIGATDYVAIWQNGANAWIPYGQLVGGQTINQLPAAAPAADSDMLLVAQGGSALNVQSFGALWTYLQAKIPTLKSNVVELTANTVLDGSAHNDRLLVASQPITLTANFSNMGSGFACTLINLSAGSVTMGTGITSGSGSTSLPPGTSTSMVGLTYSGGSLVWWSGIVPNAPTITVASIAAPAPSTGFTVTGGIFNDAPTALDYSTNGGASWVAVTSPVITANAFSFALPGLTAGTYTVRVRDHANTAVQGVSNSFTVIPPSVTIAATPASLVLGAPLSLSGTVSPALAAVRVGYSSSLTVAPASWVNASVVNSAWTAVLTPAAAGTIYVWAEQSSATSVQAMSSAISVVAASLTITAPSSGTAGSVVTVTGTVNPAADAVNVQLATQNTTAPASGWTAAVNSGGSFALSLTPAAAGTYYAWAQDPTSGLTAVSAAITVAAQPALVLGINSPSTSGPYVHNTGSIGLNGAITPTQPAAVQVALSTSNTVVPTSGWQAALDIYNDELWAIYYPTPASAGVYYVWVQTTTGGSTAVSSYAITVT
jgi:hypothetical protein